MHISNANSFWICARQIALLSLEMLFALVTSPVKSKFLWFLNLKANHWVLSLWARPNISKQHNVVQYLCLGELLWISSELLFPWLFICIEANCFVRKLKWLQDIADHYNDEEEEWGPTVRSIWSIRRRREQGSPASWTPTDLKRRFPLSNISGYDIAQDKITYLWNVHRRELANQIKKERKKHLAKEATAASCAAVCHSVTHLLSKCSCCFVMVKAESDRSIAALSEVAVAASWLWNVWGSSRAIAVWLMWWKEWHHWHVKP